jgi:CBS domain containing-hemolysin-like protein
MANLLSRRLFWPKFRPEPYLRVGDLERAVQLSTSDATLLEQEQRVLQNIVSLSEIPVNELMRPRVQFLVFRPPVSLADLQGRMPPSGCLLVAEPDSDEVTAAISLRDLSSVPTEQLERYAEPVVYVPWCTPVAQALETMQRQNRRVAAVVNEHGETIGILTFDDMLETIFGRSPSRSQRLLEQAPIRQVGPETWHVTGMTSLRRLVRYFGVPRPPSRSVTVTGVVQETLGRMAKPGDRCRWGPFQFTVLHVLQRGRLLVELTVAENGAEKPAADEEGSP